MKLKFKNTALLFSLITSVVSAQAIAADEYHEYQRALRAGERIIGVNINGQWFNGAVASASGDSITVNMDSGYRGGWDRQHLALTEGCSANSKYCVGDTLNVVNIYNTPGEAKVVGISIDGGTIVTSNGGYLGGWDFEHILGIKEQNKDAHSVSLSNISQGLYELSKVVYDNSKDDKSWSRAKLLQALAKDSVKDQIKSEDSNKLLLIAVNSLVAELTAPVISEKFKPKFAQALMSGGVTSVNQIEANPATLNMAIAIIEKSLLTIRSYQATPDSDKYVQSLIAKLAKDVSTQERFSHKLMALADFTEKLARSEFINTALENPRTAPEASMLNLVMGWIAKK